ncbi:hypothetical protein DFH27DRAFT_555186 [Peziza echinospora]|nr:hypothetical protein DFH27DRAFT_555186 [Peziza echinospora]
MNPSSHLHKSRRVFLYPHLSFFLFLFWFWSLFEWTGLAYHAYFVTYLCVHVYFYFHDLNVDSRKMKFLLVKRFCRHSNLTFV